MSALMDSSVVIVAVLTFTSVICIGGAFLAYAGGRRQVLQERLHGARAANMIGEDSSEGSLLGTLARLGTKVGAGASSSGLYTRMLRAGFQSRSAVPVFMATKLLLFIGSFLLFIPAVALVDVSFGVRMFIAFGAAAFIFFIPNLYIDYLASKRALEVRLHLPDMVDLLEVCVSGGMGLDQAWNAVGSEIRQVSPLLADEMALTTLEMQLGEERGVALRHMADRTGAADLSAMVSALVQSERFGTSVSQALKVFAENMREMRSSRAEENAETMAVKMLFPMVVFIFPVVLIVAVGPAAIELVAVFSEM